MIFAWITAKGLLGLKKGYWLLFALCGVIALYLAFSGVLNRMEDNARESGASAQREADLTETIRNVEKANEAAATVRRDPDAFRAECMHNARNPADC